MTGERQQQRTPQRSTIEAAKDPSTNLMMLAAEVSVVLSWYEFFLRGNKMRGLFVALWPPTILAFASYFHQKRMEEKMDTFTPQGLSNTLTKVLGGQ